MKVAIVLVNWNGWKDTVECLESVFRLDYPDFQVIVVDNDSHDDSLAHIREWADGKQAAPKTLQPELLPLTDPPIDKPIRYVELDRQSAECGQSPHADASLILVRSGENLGFAGGNNIGLRFAMAQPDTAYAWLLNNDTVVARDSLVALVATHRTAPDAGIVGSTLLYYGEPGTVQALGGATFDYWRGRARHIGALTPHRPLTDTETRDVERRIDYPIGASMLVSADFLREVGLMDEGYFLYYEEIDWALRGRKKYRSLYAQASLVYHKVGKSAGNESRMSWHFLCRSRRRFMARHFPARRPLLYLLMLWELAKAIVRGRRAESQGLRAVLADPDAWPAGAYRPRNL